MKPSAPLLFGLSLFCLAAIAQKKSPTAPAAPAAAVGSAPEATMKPGLWEITTVNETAGSATKRTVTSRSCYGAADVANVGRVVPQQRDFGMKCQTREAKQQGSEATWRVACSGKDSVMNGVGKMSIAAETFSGRAELELKKPPAKAVKVEQRISGGWLGPCK